MIIHFVEHAVLLLALCWLLTLNSRCWERRDKLAKLTSGCLLGLATVAGIMMAIKLEGGGLFDGRSVILSMAAFAGGPLVAVIAAGFAVGYRIWLGGAGLSGGLLIMLMAVLLGLAYRTLYQRGKVGKGLGSLFCFGFILHLGVLLLFALLPAPNSGPIVLQMGVPMLIVMPLATVGLGWMLEDIKRRRRDERELRIAATAFEMHQGLLVTDEHSRILRVNKKFSEITGYQAADVLGKQARLLRSQRQDAAFYQVMWQQLLAKGRWQGEVWSRRKNGETYPEWLSISVVRNHKGQVSHFVSSMEDMTERKTAEAQIRGLAFFDSLTGLPNRCLLLERMQHAMSAASHNGRYGALLLFNVDGFKSVNDLHGRGVGDQMLCQLATRLSKVMHASDTAARLDADQFVIMVENLSSTRQYAAERAEQYAIRLKQQLCNSYHIEQLELHRGVSIGITLFKDASEAADKLLQEAEMAMHQAKATLKQGIRFFDTTMQEAISTRMRLEEDIQRGLHAREFIPYFQPQLNDAGQVTGAEALARWQHPTLGLLSPAAFISVAEQAGLIEWIDLQMLRQACQQLAMWQRVPSTAPLVLAVNLSASVLYQPNFVATLLEYLSEAGADPHYLKLELTESMLLDDVSTAIARMQALRSHGIRFSIDDFGTGYSSLTYLQKLPLSQLKIDQSFVRELTDNTSNVAIIKTICALAESLQLTVIAEGVETEQQHQTLLELGCRHFQGYLFGRPMPIEEFADLMKNKSESVVVQF